LQIYRGFDVATAKPTPAERALAPYHLIDFVDPARDFNLADYVRRAEEVIEEVRARGRLPIVAGGTGLYLRGLLRGVVDAPPRDAQLRRRLRKVAERRGAPSLHRWLARLDPETAGRLATGDTQRIVRAMELVLSGDATWSRRLREEGTWESGVERYDALKIGLDADRERLNLHLDERVDRFFAGGLVDEVRGLLARGVPPEANAFKAIGYREVLAALRSGEDPDAVRDVVKRNTRRYVKRQRTWFRKEPGVIWLDALDGTERLAEQAEACWRRFGAS
jgi:tRNA dimethylallyltransferase